MPRISKAARMIKLRLQVAEARERLAIFMEGKGVEEQALRANILAIEHQIRRMQEQELQVNAPKEGEPNEPKIEDAE